MKYCVIIVWRGSAEEACCVYTTEVGGSKPSPANIYF